MAGKMQPPVRAAIWDELERFGPKSTPMRQPDPFGFIYGQPEKTQPVFRPMSIRDHLDLAKAPKLGEKPDGRDSALGAAQGITAYGAQNGLRAEQVRGQYSEAVRRLPPYANAERSQIKSDARGRTPAPQRYIVQAARPSTGPAPGSSGSAHRANPRIDRLGRTLGLFGRASLGAGLILDGAEVLDAEDKTRAAAQAVGGNVGGWAGGVAGAEAGGTLGAFGGPWGAAGGAVVGGVLGAFGGGLGGRRVGREAVDHLRRDRGL